PSQTNPAARRQFFRKGPIKTNNPGIFADSRRLGQRLTEKGAYLLTERVLCGGKLEGHNTPLYYEVPVYTGRDASPYTPNQPENQMPSAPASSTPGLSRTSAPTLTPRRADAAPCGRAISNSPLLLIRQTRWSCGPAP